jgi:anti-anti-sigma factor
LEIGVEPGQDRVVIRVEGEMDLFNVARVEEAIDTASEESTGLIVVDMGGVEFIDSTGLSVLVRATRRSREDGNRLRVRGASGQVRRILEVAGVHEWLGLEEAPD